MSDLREDMEREIRINNALQGAMDWGIRAGEAERSLAAAQERIAELEAALERVSRWHHSGIVHMSETRPLAPFELVPIEECRREPCVIARVALAGSQGGGDLPQAERQCIACKRRWFVPAQSVSVLGAYWYCELCAGSQGGREAIGSCMGCGGAIRLVNGEPVGPCPHCMPQATADTETTAPECRDGWHAIRPGEGACVCGENRMELML